MITTKDLSTPHPLDKAALLEGGHSSSAERGRPCFAAWPPDIGRETRFLIVDSISRGGLLPSYPSLSFFCQSANRSRDWLGSSSRPLLDSDQLHLFLMIPAHRGGMVSRNPHSPNLTCLDQRREDRDSSHIRKKDCPDTSNRPGNSGKLPLQPLWANSSWHLVSSLL